MSHVLSIAELAERLGVSRPIAYQLAHRADFPAIRVSPRRIIVPAAALDRWLEEQAAEKGGFNE